MAPPAPLWLLHLYDVLFARAPQMGSGPPNHINYTSFPFWRSPRTSLILARTWSFILPHLQGQWTHHLWAFAMLDFLVITAGWRWRQIAAVAVDRFWVVRSSEALEPTSISLILLTEMWEMINAMLSHSHSFLDVWITTGYHFNMAIWHGIGNCPSVIVHLSLFFSIRIWTEH